MTSTSTSTNTEEGDIDVLLEEYTKKTGTMKFGAKFLQKIKIQVAESKYKKKRCCPYCPFKELSQATLVQKLARHVSSKHIEEPRVTALRIVDQEMEDIRQGPTTESSTCRLQELHREREKLTHLIVYEGLYKYNVAVFREALEKNNFENRIIVARDPTVMDNPNAYEYLPCPNCLGFFSKKTMYRHKNECPGVDSPHKCRGGKTPKAAMFALMLEIKADHDSPYHKYIYHRMRNDELGELAKNDPLIRYLGEFYYDKRKQDEGYHQINDRMRSLAKLVKNLNCKYLIEVIQPDMWKKVKNAMQDFQVSYRVKLGSTLKTGATFLRNLAIMWNKRTISETSENFIKLIDSEWASISAPAKYE